MYMAWGMECTKSLSGSWRKWQRVTAWENPGGGCSLPPDWACPGQIPPQDLASLHCPIISMSFTLAKHFMLNRRKGRNKELGDMEILLLFDLILIIIYTISQRIYKFRWACRIIHNYLLEAKSKYLPTTRIFLNIHEQIEQ